MHTLFHALGLHMHQPPDNLRLLIESNAWEAEQIMRCYERAARYAGYFPDHAHLHVGFSGVLLEQLRDPQIIDRYRHIADIPAMLDTYRQTSNVELIGMGYYSSATAGGTWRAGAISAQPTPMPPSSARVI